MKEVTLRVHSGKYKFFMELIKNFDFVSVNNSPDKKELLLSIARGMKQAQLADKGKIKSRLAKSFLNDL